MLFTLPPQLHHLRSSAAPSWSSNNPENLGPSQSARPGQPGRAAFRVLASKHCQDDEGDDGGDSRLWWWSSDPMWLWSRWRLHRRRGGFGTFMSCVEINLFKLKSAPVFTPTNWDLISKTLVRLFYTKKPAGRGCNRWREVGWKANLGDAYVLRVPLGLPWVGRIWQKRSVQQKNPPLCLSMGY